MKRLSLDEWCLKETDILGFAVRISLVILIDLFICIPAFSNEEHVFTVLYTIATPAEIPFEGVSIKIEETNQETTVNNNARNEIRGLKESSTIFPYLRCKNKKPRIKEEYISDMTLLLSNDETSLMIVEVDLLSSGETKNEIEACRTQLPNSLTQFL